MCAFRVIVFSVEGGVTCFFDEALLLAGEEDRGVGLAEKEPSESLNEAADDGGRVENPSPGRQLCNPSTSNRPQRGTQQRCDRIDRYSPASLLWPEQIRKHTTSTSHGRRPSYARKEPENNHLRLGLGQGAAEVEEEEPEI